MRLLFDEISFARIRPRVHLAIAILAVLCCGLLSGQGKLPARAKRNLPPEVERLVGESYVGPSEFTADSLLRISRLSRGPGKEARADLLEQAFQLAGRASEPVALKMTVPVRVITRSQTLASGMLLGYDRTTLQSRIARAMLEVDSQRARDMFERIRLPLTPVGCDAALVPNVTSYFVTARAIAVGAFSEDERKKELPAAFIRHILAAIQSPVEVAPAADLIASAQLAPAEAQSLVWALMGIIERLHAGDREFSASLDAINRAIDNSILPLVPPQLASAVRKPYRQFLAAHFQGKRCAENVDPGSAQQKTESTIVARFAADLPFSQAERSPSEVLPGFVAVDLLPHTPRYNEMVGKLYKRGLSEDVQKGIEQTKEWQEGARALLEWLLSLDHAPGQSDLDFEQERVFLTCSAGAAFFSPSWREQKRSACIKLLSTSPLQHTRWMEWMDRVLAVAIGCRDETCGDELAALEASSNPVLAEFARLERVLGTRIKDY
jgi:hypothetical protein